LVKSVPRERASTGESIAGVLVSSATFSVRKRRIEMVIGGKAQSIGGRGTRTGVRVRLADGLLDPLGGVGRTTADRAELAV
jgi:hypothetical protein